MELHYSDLLLLIVHLKEKPSAKVKVLSSCQETVERCPKLYQVAKVQCTCSVLLEAKINEFLFLFAS